MAISFTLHNVSIINDRILSPQDAAKALVPDTALRLYDPFSETNPEEIRITLNNGIEIGVVPAGVAIEIREITSDFDELSARIEKVVRQNGFSLDIDICLSDFSWDESGAFPIVKLTSNNSRIKPAQGTFSYNIYHAKLKLKKLQEEGEIIERQYKASRSRR